MAGPGLATISEGLWLALCCSIEVMGWGWLLQVRGLELFQGWPLGVRVRACQAKAGVARHGQAGSSMGIHGQAWPGPNFQDLATLLEALEVPLARPDHAWTA